MATRLLDPFDERTARPYLERLALRIQRGDCPRAIRKQLFDDLWPWAHRHASTLARRTPQGADRNETMSNVLFAFYRVTQSFDAERWQSWPTLLATSLRGARIDAARSDDVLSRRQRNARSAYQQAHDQRTASLGRPLTSEEDDGLLERVAPNVATDAYQALFIRAEIRREPVEGLEVASMSSDPEATVIGEYTAAAVRHWIREDLPPRVRSDVLRWLGQERRRDGLPQRTRARLQPYLPSLMARISGADRTG